MSAKHNFASSAMVAVEAEIMDLWDGGSTLEQIAIHVNRQPGYVRSVVGNYTVRTTNPFDKMVVRGSAALLAAIRRHHPEYCRGGRA